FFPATRLLAKVARRRKTRFDIQHFLLLLARILVIATVVLAASKPGLVVERPGGIRSGPALGQVIILDDSLSMRLQGEDGRTIFNRAKQLALAEIARLRPGDAAALVLTGSPTRPPTAEMSFDLANMRRGLGTMEPSFLRGDLKNALRKAMLVLQESHLPQQEVVLITDLSNGGQNESKPPWSRSSGIGYRVVDAGADVKRVNTAISEVVVSPSPGGVAREVNVEVRISNYSNVPQKGLEVVLEVEGGEVAQGSLDVPANGSSSKRFFHRFDKDGTYRGLVRIGKDALPEDNVRYFAVTIRRSIPVLIINGDYRPGSYRDETFYLRRALETPMPGEVTIQPLIVDVDTAMAGTLSGNSVVFLAGVSNLSAALAGRLIDYVKHGGGLFVSPSANGGLLSSIKSILPAKVRSITQTAGSGQPLHIAAVNRSHPMFVPFGNGPTGLENTTVSAHLLVEPEPSTNRRTLIDLVGGLPLLLERQVGEGRIMLLTTTVDRDWTDLPIRPGYLPLMQRATRYLAGRLDDYSPRRILAGQPIDVEVSQGMQRLIVRGPGKRNTTFAARDLADKLAIEFVDTLVPGHYQVWAEILGFGGLREIPALGFVVETHPEESNPKRVISIVDENNLSNFAPVRGVFPLWPYLLIGLILLILLETVVSVQGLRRSHIKALGSRD
ncbi:MAG: VWA domain-containing protein, partial [Proteobacteria bacterium]|nr:VWA domain-containing protein [Pseudomonadota bacterium]